MWCLGGRMVLKTDKRFDFKMFALLVVSILAGLIISLAMCLNGSFDTDFLWHTVLRDYIVEHKSLPVQDIFSWRSIEMGYTETAHSWLGSLILGSYVRFAESIDLSYFVCSVSFALIWYVVSCLVIKKVFFKNGVNGFYFFACLFSSFSYTHARIQNMSYILFVILLAVLFDMYRNAKSNSYMLLPVLAILCANLHGGIIILFVGIMFIFGTCLMVPGFDLGVFRHVNDINVYGGNRMAGKRVLACSVISLIAGCINPYGIKLYTYFLHVSSDPFNSIYVGEWKPVSVNNFIFILTVIAFMIPLFLKNKKIDLLTYGVPFGFTILAGWHCRFLNYAIFSMIPLVLSYYEYYLEYMQYKKENAKVVEVVDETTMKKRMTMLYIGTGVIIIIGIIFIIFTGKTSFENANLTNSIASVNTVTDKTNVVLDDVFGNNGCVLSDDVVTYLDEAQYERMYCTYNLGGELIFSGFKSFVDSRADCFKNGELSDSAILCRTLKSKEELDKIVEKYDFDAFIFESNYWFSFEMYLDSRDDFVRDYEDDFVIIYKRVE